MEQDLITAEKIERYLELTRKALEKITVVAPKPSWLHRVAEDHLAMARHYHDDARHFHAQGDLVNAFASVNYAHGWLDAGVRLGVFDAHGDDALFTLLE